MTTMYAVDVYHPSCALAVASPGGVWRMPRSTLSKSLRGWRGFVRARLQGSLHAVSHVEYDTSEPAARMGRDCIDRRTLVIGPAFVLAYLARLPGGESGDIFKDMDKLFVYREDADEAVNDLGRVDKRDSQTGWVLIQGCSLGSSHGPWGLVG